MTDLTPDERAAIEARAAMAPGVEDDSPLRPLIDALRSWDGSGPAPDGPDDLAVWRWYDDAAKDRSTLLAALAAAEVRAERLTDALRLPQTITFADEASARCFYAASARAVTHPVAAEARTEAVTIGPIRHAASLCAQPSGCNCWCAECERRRPVAAVLVVEPVEDGGQQP